MTVPAAPARPRPIRLPALAGVLLAALVWLAPAGLATDDEAWRALEGDEDQALIADRILLTLDRQHYGDLRLDDELSDKLFDRYLRWLDPSRLFLLASDVARFEDQRLELDDALRAGDLQIAYDLFNLLQERRAARLQWLLDRIEAGLESLDLTDDEVLELDREEAPWPADAAAADDLWRRRLENAVVGLRLADQELDEIAETLTRRYADQLRRVQQLTGQDVFRTFMNAVVQGYDPHTEYYPPLQAENFDISMSLSFEGIGALLGSDGEYCRIERLIPGGPAEGSGELQATDRIVWVAQGDDGERVDVVGWRNDDIVELIRGEKGSTVRLGILGANQSDVSAAKQVKLVRDQVKLEEQAARSKTVEVEADGGAYTVGVIELPAFYMDFDAARAGDPDFKSATRDVARLVGELTEQGVDGLVLDLRNNGGGSLIEAQELTRLFLGGGPVVQIRDARDRVEVLGVRPEPPAYTGPLAVLVNRLSASASEIFAAAVQDTGRGLVLGNRTFGKGTVQQLTPLGDGQLKLTQAKFYRISGGSTQHRGVKPDVRFPEVFDPDEIGESSLEGALPWDRIAGVPHPRDDQVASLADDLQAVHEARLESDPELRHLVERIAQSQALADDTSVPLSLEARRARNERLEAQSLAIENRLRAAQGKPEVASFDELDELDEPGFDDALDVDPLGQEAARVLVDFLIGRQRASPKRMVHTR